MMNRQKPGITKAFRESMAAVREVSGLDTEALLFKLVYSHETDGLCITYDIGYNGSCCEIPAEFDDEPVSLEGCIYPDEVSGRPACFVFVLDPGDSGL